jgi:beta-galactosidase
MHGNFTALDYFKFAPFVDVIAWDSYPTWHSPQGDAEIAAEVAFIYDACRAAKSGRPWMLMESVPSTSNWKPINKLKRPGMHRLSSLQAIAHGSETVQYFQWRQSRGSAEKFHGAVLDHSGRSDTRVFRDVAALGAALPKLDAVLGSTVHARVAVILDVENGWAIEAMQALGKETRRYRDTVIQHYRSFWKAGIAVDVIDETYDLSRYALVVAPMAYMLRPGFAEKVERFVAEGGTFVTTYWSGLVNENDLAFLGGFPAQTLRQVLGIWNEETDATWPGEFNSVVVSPPHAGLQSSYKAAEIFALIHAETAQTIATYGGDFYAGSPALTVNRYGRGQAWYIASRNEQSFHDDFYCMLAHRLNLPRAIETDLPAGVSATRRSSGGRDFIFLLNFTSSTHAIDLGDGKLKDLLTGAATSGIITLEPYGVRILTQR